MSELGQFLEAVCGPDERFATLRATIRQWTDRGIAATASSPHRTPIGRRKVPQGVQEGIDETNLRVWLRPPDCVRIESTKTKEEHQESKLTIVAGDRWWCRDDEGHVETHEGSASRIGPSTTDTERHFDGEMLRNFLGGLSLAQTGLLQVAERRCARVRAVQRPDGQIWPHWLPSDADEYEFHADPERGVLLGILSISHGKPYHGSEVVDIAFDEPIDESVFAYLTDPGEQVQPSVPVVEQLSLESAIKRMPFSILVPNPLPDPNHTQLEIMYHPPRRNAPRDYLTLHFHGGDRVHRLWIEQAGTPDTDDDPFEWEDIHHEGLEMRLSDPMVEGSLRLLSFERHGTYVRIVSDLPAEELCKLAVLMSPAAVRS